MNKIFDYSAIVSGLILLLLSVLTFCDVFGRRFLNSPVAGTIEIVEFGIALVAFLAMPRAFFLNDHVSADKLNDSVMSLAKKIASKPLSTVKIGKDTFYRQYEMSLTEAYEFTSKVMTENSLSDDAIEGIASFLEKRNPVWGDD